MIDDLLNGDPCDPCSDVLSWNDCTCVPTMRNACEDELRVFGDCPVCTGLDLRLPCPRDPMFGVDPPPPSPPQLWACQVQAGEFLRSEEGPDGTLWLGEARLTGPLERIDIFAKRRQDAMQEAQVQYRRRHGLGEDVPLFVQETDGPPWWLSSP